MVLLRHGLSPTKPSMVLVPFLQVPRSLLDNHLRMDSNRFSKHPNGRSLGYVRVQLATIWKAWGS